MDTTSAIIGIIVLSLCILPFLVLSKNSRKKTKQTIGVLRIMATEHGTTIENFEIDNTFIIGMNPEQDKLFFFKKTATENYKKVIDLNKFQACSLLKETRTIGEKNNYYTIIERLALTFNPTPTDKSENELEFYNSNKTIQLSGEFQAIEKWSKIINNRYKHARVTT